MSWAITYTATAKQDLRDIHKYIAQELCVPETAEAQSERIMKAVRALEEFPMRYRLYEYEPWNSRGLRVLPVDNYLVLFLPDEDTNLVYVVRIMYSGRDVRRQLKGTKLEY